MADKPAVVVLISVDPRVSHRANEAMRIGLGVTAGENDVTFVLTGPAAHLLDEDTDELVDGDDIAKFRAALRNLDVRMHVERAAVPTDSTWNPDGLPVVPVSPEEVADLIARADRALVF